jgi:hypothetical protein
MGIVEDFLSKSSDAVPANTSAGIVERYLKEVKPQDIPAEVKRVYIVKPPISGASKEQSDVINAEPSQAPIPNTTPDFPSLSSTIGGKAMEGVNQMQSGVKNIFDKQPATGVGEIGSGLLGVATSIPTGIGQFATDVTGNESLKDKLPLAFGALPVGKAGSLASAKVPKNESFRKLVEDIGEKNLPTVIREMKADPRLTPADLVPAVKQGVQKLYAGVEGPHVNYLGNVTEQRLKTAADDLQQHMNANLGTVVDPVKKLAELKQNIRDVGAEHINPAIKGAGPVDLTGAIKNIDAILSPGVKSVISHDTVIADPNLERTLRSLRKYITDGESVRIDPEQLNRLQSAFRKKAELTQKSDPYLANAIFKVRNDIVDAIDKSSGGKYKPALEKYRDEYHIQDAFEHGHDAIMANGKKLSDRPEFFEKWIKDASSEELAAAKEGARIAYDTQMYGFKHAAKRGTDIGDVEFNRRRMSALFGKEEAEKMSKVFENAKKIAETNNHLVQNSQTQMRNVQNSYFKPHEPDKVSNPLATAVNVGLPIAGEVAGTYMGLPISGLGAAATGAGLLAAKGAAKAYGAGKSAVIRSMEENRNLGYARYALPTQGDRDELIRRLEAVANRPAKQSIVRRGANTLSRIIPP